MDSENPKTSSAWPYILAAMVISGLALIGVVVLLVMRPDKDNASLVTQIFGFAATITMATLAYMRSSETRLVVNSRMDEFKRSLQQASIIAQAQAHAEGKLQGQTEGRAMAEARTDRLVERAAAAVVIPLSSVLRTKIGGE